MEQTTKIALGIGVGIALLLGCCVGAIGLAFTGCTRGRVLQPAVEVSVRSARGPLRSATVEHVWWSNPHGTVHETSSHSVDDSGRLELSLITDTERIMPLCMHGVPEHQHQLCVDAEGYRPIGLIVRDHRVPVTGELELDPGEGTCHEQIGWGERLPTEVANVDAFTILPPR